MTDDAKQIEEVAEEVTPRRDVVLNGEYRFKVDGKGRVSLPAKFRKVLSTQLVVAKDLDNECLYVFETPDFEALDRPSCSIRSSRRSTPPSVSAGTSC